MSVWKKGKSEQNEGCDSKKRKRGRRDGEIITDRATLVLGARREEPRFLLSPKPEQPVA